MSISRLFTIPVAVYEVAGLDSLPTTKKSARLIGQHVEANWPGGVLANRPKKWQLGKWNESRVRAYLEAGLAAATPTDDVVIYWAGHASGTPLHFHLSDGGTIHCDDLADWMLNSPARSILLLLDCCYSGNGVDDLLRHFLRKRETDGEPPGRTVSVIASTAPGRLANEGYFVASLLSVLKGRQPIGLDEAHTVRSDEPLMTPEQLAKAVTACLSADGIDQEAQARVLLGSPGKLIPRRAMPFAGTIAGDSRIRRDLSRATLLAGYDWNGQLTRRTLAAIEQFVSLGPATPTYRYLYCVATGARLAMTIEKVLRALLPPVPGFNLPSQLRRAYFVACGTWLDYEWPSTLDYAYAITQRTTNRSQFDVARSLLIFATRLVYECGADTRSIALYEWARLCGISDVAFAVAQRESCRALGERRLVVEFLPSGRISQEQATRLLRGQLWVEGSFMGDPKEVRLDGQGVDAALIALSELIGSRSFRGSFDSVDLVLPSSLIALDTATASVQLADGRKVPIDQAVSTHRRFGERLWDSSEVEAAEHMYGRILGSIDQLMFFGREDFQETDLHNRIREGGFGVAVLGESLAHHDWESTLLDLIRATPITIWPTGPEVPVADLIRENWPEVPEAIRRARSSATPADLSSEASLLCIWEDPAWLAIALSISSYDEEGIA